jgi:sugar phosphate isomerase/epimerase
MYLTGFADEAAGDIDGQIRATKELGWKYIEARNIGGKNIHDISDEDFDIVCEKLEKSGVGINCFGSAIANWGKQITERFDASLSEAKRAIPRMKRLGTKLIRIMSFAVLKDREADDQMEQERFGRLRELTKMFWDEGLVPVHENCMNYGGMSWKHTLKILENVPGLKLVYDTGNPVSTADYLKPKPYPKQSSWEFYSHVKEHVVYVHIKDGVFNEKTGEATYTYPGEGDGDVRKIVKDMLKRGYDGGFSMEPHLKIVAHDDSKKATDEARYAAYVEYGRRFEKMVKEIKKEIRLKI